MEVNKILIPNKPHLDPIAAIYLLLKYGQQKFQGIATAKISYWKASQDPDLEELEDLQSKGILLLDVGGGFFDHHNKKDADGETTTSLVASYLGIKENPEIITLVNYIREDDLEGLHNRFGDLANTLKVMYKQDIANNEVVKYALNTLNYLQNGQMQWHYEVRQEFEEKANIKNIKRNKRKLKVAIIESDNVQVANYGLVVKNMSVVIQKRSTGHIMILTNKNHRIDLREIIGAIRKRELELMGYDKEIDINRLKFEGKNQLLPNWFYHRSLNSFLNGSDALSNSEATKVEFNDIIRFVIYGICTDESELCDCNSGGSKCPYKDYGFSKCKSYKEKSKLKYKININSKSLIIPIKNDYFSNLPNEIISDNTKLVKKDEFHITVIGFSNGYKIKKLLERNRDIENKINNIVSEFDLEEYKIKEEKYHIKQDKIITDKNSGNVKIIHKESVIQEINYPVLDKLYKKLKSEGIDLENTPFPHITLYTDSENKTGIGVNSKEELKALNPKLINI